MTELTYHQKWYLENKDKHREYCLTKVKCPDCGAMVCRSAFTKHRQTKKHQEARNKIEAKYEALKKKYKRLAGGSKTNKKQSVDIYDILKKPEEYAPKGSPIYKPDETELAKINSDPKRVARKIKELLKKGYVEIHTKEELENFPLRSVVAYITTKGLYRSGGFLKSIQDKYFVLQGGSPTQPISFCVQFDNVESMYVHNPWEVKKKEEREEEEDE